MSKWLVLSPDGITLDYEPVLADTPEEAWKQAEEFAKRYEFQGYYADAYRRRIPIDQIPHECRIVEVDDDYLDDEEEEED